MLFKFHKFMRALFALSLQFSYVSGNFDEILISSKLFFHKIFSVSKSLFKRGAEKVFCMKTCLAVNTPPLNKKIVFSYEKASSFYDIHANHLPSLTVLKTASKPGR